MKDDSRWELVQLFLDGLASEDESLELAQALESDPQLRQDFLAYTRLDGNLSTIVRSEAEQVIPMDSQRRSGRFI